MTYTVGSLCSGYGGLDRAVEAALGPHRLAWYAEFDDAPASVMAHHWPNVPNLRDLTKIDWATVEPVDVLTAGYPCQPFSLAGHRKGTDDPRHPWPYIAAAVRVLRPRLVVLENVSGHLGLGFDSVLADLAAIGFDAEWSVVRASDVGACHQRARLFVVAAPRHADRPRADAFAATGPSWEAVSQPDRGDSAPADAGGPGRREEPRGSYGDEADDARRSSPDDHVPRGAGPSRLPTANRTEAPADTGGLGRERRTPIEGTGRYEAERSEASDHLGDGVGSPTADADGIRREGSVTGPYRDDGRSDPRPPTDTDGRRCGQFAEQHGSPALDPAVGPAPRRHAHGRGDQDDGVSWGAYEPAIARHAQLVRRPAPSPVDDRGRLNPRFVEWMMTLPDGHVTDVLTTRTKALKALGNGVVPLQAAYAIAGLVERLHQP